MFQRVMRISLWAVSAVVLLGADVRAQFFDGWAFFCCSEVTGVIDLIQVPDPEEKPSVVVVKGRLKDIEVVCKSPDGHDVSETDAGARRFEAANAIEEDEFTDGKCGHADKGTGRKLGCATVVVKFGEKELRDAEEDARCEKPRGRVVQGSAAPRTLALTMKSFRCTPDSKYDPEPCFEGYDDKLRGGHPSPDVDNLTVERPPIDTVELLCTLDDIRRGKDLRPKPGQKYHCVEH